MKKGKDLVKEKIIRDRGKNTDLTKNFAGAIQKKKKKG